MGRDRGQAAPSFLQTIIDSLDDELLVIDRSFLITQANQALLRAKGWARNQVIGHHCYEVSHRRNSPCDSANDDCPTRRVLSTGQPARATHIHVDYLGRTSYVDIVASPIRDAEGNVVEVIEVMRDVSQLKLLENTLLQRNRELAAVNTVASIAHHSLDYRKVLESVLSTVVELFDLDAGFIYTVEKEGQSLELAASAGFPEGVLSSSQSITAVENLPGVVVQSIPALSAESEKKLPCGELADHPDWRDRTCTCVPLSAKGKVLGLMGLFQLPDRPFSNDDLVLVNAIGGELGVALENAKLYSQLHAEKSKMEALIGGIGDGISIQNRDMRIVFVNDVHRQTFGDDIVGQPCYEVYERRDAICSSCPVKSVFETGQPCRTVRVGINRAGEQRHFDITAGPIFDESGKVIQAIEVTRDVTHEVELAKLKDEFISVASHEFRSPLAIIRGYAEMIQNRDRLKLDRSQEEHLLDQVIEEVDGLAMLVQDTLNVSRLDSGEIQPNLQPVSLFRVLDKIVQSMSFEAADRDMSLSVDAPRDVFVYADPIYVERIVVNLLSNAINYSEDGKNVYITARVAKQMMEVSIKDEGVGIAPEHIRQLFGKFVRLPNSRSSRVKGTGLGLYITKGLVEAQGGRIWVESTPDKGSTFTFTLPIALS